jgi:hypothetical protein
MLSKDCGGNVLGSFSNRLLKVVGNGIDTLFWFDLWVVGEICMDKHNQSF